jgi:hypothetical protein
MFGLFLLEKAWFDWISGKFWYIVDGSPVKTLIHTAA